MDHSLHSIDRHFEGRSPAVREIYDAIVTISRRFGPVREEAKNAAIHLVNKTVFAGIKARRDYLTVTFKSHQDASSRVIKREHTSANRWYLEIKLLSKKDIDGALKSWLKHAYRLSA